MTSAEDPVHPCKRMRRRHVAHCRQHTAPLAAPPLLAPTVVACLVPISAPPIDLNYYRVHTIPPTKTFCVRWLGRHRVLPTATAGGLPSRPTTAPPSLLGPRRRRASPEIVRAPARGEGGALRLPRGAPPLRGAPGEVRRAPAVAGGGCGEIIIRSLCVCSLCLQYAAKRRVPTAVVAKGGQRAPPMLCVLDACLCRVVLCGSRVEVGYAAVGVFFLCLCWQRNGSVRRGEGR